MDPTKAKMADAKRKTDATASPAAALDPKEGKVLVSSVQFEPERSGMYCHGAPNKVHTDPVVAQEFGYEAPIWGGMQGGHICLAYVFKQLGGPVNRLDCQLWFRRPVFWNELTE